MTQPALSLLGDPTGHRDVDAGWLQWLTSHTDQRWRPGEWDQALWLFTGDLDNPRTAVWLCRTPACFGAALSHDRRCATCRRLLRHGVLDEEAFDAEHRRQRSRLAAQGACLVAGCQSDMLSRGLCFRHQDSWRKTGLPLETFAARARPLTRSEPSAVVGCERESVTRRGLCGLHGKRLRDQNHDLGALSGEDLASWVAGERPFLAAHQFSMIGLDTLVRAELLYALQRRDETPPPLDPRQVRVLVNKLVGTGSVRLRDEEVICRWRSGPATLILGLFRDVVHHLERAWTTYAGVDPYAGDTWDVDMVDLWARPSRQWAAREGVVDFGPIGLPWLREVTKDWARTTRPTLLRLREMMRACKAVSVALASNGRTDPTALDAADFALANDAISGLCRADGALFAAHTRNVLIWRFRELVAYGRESGLIATVPVSFGRHRAKRLADDRGDDETGRAIPEFVIRQLDAKIHLLGPDGGSGSPIHRREVHQLIYRILRDTGRRPGEVVSLKVGCIEVVDGQHLLVYDNHKAGRMRRRLPITAETAEAVLAWERRRVELPDPPLTRQWLFPSPQLRARQASGHLEATAVSGAFLTWRLKIGTIDSEVLGISGLPVPFDLSLVVPGALRHSYAQRHADAGVAVDVLRDLMDHVSVQTTMGYYRVSLKRKQQAIRAVGSLATDANGNVAPFTNALAWERASVSVPFGNCTEPSNVKAGGGSCPIRYQCAGCGFYRPDPSYLPAIEEHIASLRADRETGRAIGAADYVISNLTAQIEAFSQVADAMGKRLANLGVEERTEVEEASRLLRRSRAARLIPVIPDGIAAG